MDPRIPWLLALFLMLALLWLWRRAATRIARANRGRQRIAQAAERAAEHLVRRAGYRVVDRQVTQRWTMWVNGEAHQVWCRTDLLLKKRGRHYAADVKTGNNAPDPTIPATRRQLFEYLHAFDVDGVLVVDMERGEILELEYGL